MGAQGSAFSAVYVLVVEDAVCAGTELPRDAACCAVSFAARRLFETGPADGYVAAAEVAFAYL